MKKNITLISLIFISFLFLNCGGEASYSLEDISLDNPNINNDENTIIIPKISENINLNPNIIVIENESVFEIIFNETPTINYNTSLSGDDADFFILNNNKLFFKNIPFYNPAEDFNKDNIYSVNILVKSNGNTLEIPLNITISEDKNHVLPVIISDNLFINENYNNVKVLAETSANANLLYYLYGDDKDNFTIDNNGTISFNNTPDFENPIDLNKDNNYSLIIKVIDDSLYKNEVSKNINIIINPIREELFTKDITYGYDWDYTVNNVFNVGKNYTYNIEMEVSKLNNNSNIRFELLDFDNDNTLNTNVFSINNNILTIEIPNWFSLSNSTKTYYVKVKVLDDLGNYSEYKLIFNAN